MNLFSDVICCYASGKLWDNILCLWELPLNSDISTVWWQCDLHLSYRWSEIGGWSHSVHGRLYGGWKLEIL